MDGTPSLMNSLNALGFLVLGSTMNAIPALAPALIAQGDFSTRALWLHFMGLVVGGIGTSYLLRECLIAFRIARTAALAAVRPAVAPAPARGTAPATLQ